MWFQVLSYLYLFPQMTTLNWNCKNNVWISAIRLQFKINVPNSTESLTLNANLTLLQIPLIGLNHRHVSSISRYVYLILCTKNKVLFVKELVKKNKLYGGFLSKTRHWKFWRLFKILILYEKKSITNY